MSMSNTSDLLLPQIEIPGMEPQIPEDIEHPENPNGPADGGIGRRHVEHPLIAHMKRPEGTPPGTQFYLYWGNNPLPVAQKIISDEDEELVFISFSVYSNYIREFWADPVFVQVKRPSGNPQNSEPLRLRVNRRRPGGRDSDDTPGNQNLVFELPPDVVSNGINEERALLGIEVIFRYWENMSIYDLIVLVWGSERVFHRVAIDELNKDIHILVKHSTIEAAGNGETIPVAFQVIGPTGNYPDEWEPFSAVKSVDVHLNTVRPAAPRIVFPITERDIDLAELGTHNVIIELYIDQPDAALYSRVFLIWAGIDSEGNSVPQITSQVIAGDGTYTFEISNALVTAIAKGTATVHYIFQGNSLPDKPSYKLHLRVVGDIIKWLAPTIDEQIGDHLDPNLPKITIRFRSQASWQASDTLSVTMLASSEDDTIEYMDERPVGEFSPGEEMIFEVLRGDLQRFHDRLTEVYYSVTRGMASPKSSLRLKVQLEALMPPLRDYTSFNDYNWNNWNNRIIGRGELAIDGAENICWRALKTASEQIEPGLQKNYDNLKSNTKYEISFYSKTASSVQSTITIVFCGITATKSLVPNRNWAGFSHIFTTATLTPHQNQTATIYFSNNTATTFLVDQIQVLETDTKKIK